MGGKPLQEPLVTFCPYMEKCLLCMPGWADGLLEPGLADRGHPEVMAPHLLSGARQGDAKDFPSMQTCSFYANTMRTKIQQKRCL